jgi:hypothetical protein
MNQRWKILTTPEAILSTLTPHMKDSTFCVVEFWLRKKEKKKKREKKIQMDD